MNFLMTMTSLCLVTSECCLPKAGEGEKSDRTSVLKIVSSNVRGLFTVAELGVLVVWRRKDWHGLKQDLVHDGGIQDAGNGLVLELAFELSLAPL